MITTGDTKSKVIAKCGEPDDVEEWEEERTLRDFRYRAFINGDYQKGRPPYLVKTYIKFEEWHYNFGTTRLIHYLRFKNGKIIKVTTGERGY